MHAADLTPLPQCSAHQPTHAHTAFLQVTRLTTNEILEPGQASFVPGEILVVSFNTSALEEESQRKRLTWVAEAPTPSALFQSEQDPALDASLAGNDRVQCEAREVVRAVPATGHDRLLWRMPERMPSERTHLWLAVAYAFRYGTVYLTDRFVLRGTSRPCLFWPQVKTSGHASGRF